MRRLLILLLLVLVEAEMPFAHAAENHAGELLWQDNVMLGYMSTEGKIIGAGNGRTFTLTAGPFDAVPYNDTRLLLRAHDDRTGKVLWTTEWNPSSGIDSARGILACGDNIVLFATSYFSHRTYLHVRAYDGRTGEDLWTNSCGPGDEFDTWISSFAAQGDRIFLAGACDGLTFMRALDLRTGEIIWETAPINQSFSIVTLGGRLFGEGSDGSGNPVLRGYDTGTGAVMWETPLSTGEQEYPVLVAAGAETLFLVVTGPVTRIAAFDAHAGTFLWSDDWGTAEGIQLALNGPSVFAAGSHGLRAYEARSGTLLWSNSEANGSIVAGGDQLFVTRDFGVWAYDATSGRVQWSSEPQTRVQYSGRPLLSAGRLYVAGARWRVEPPFGAVEALFQVRDAK